MKTFNFHNFSNTSRTGKTFWEDTKDYVARIHQFSKEDWVIYLAWVGMMTLLCLGLSTFFVAGQSKGVSFPIYAWGVPVGALIFCTAIAIDTIGHRTIYKEELKKGESLVHGITIFCGATSVMFLCMGKNYPEVFKYPALVLILLSIFYSIIDEALHWVRYFKGHSDRVEMVSHFGIFLGHGIFTLCWWVWFEQGYQGVNETFSLLGL